MKPLHSLGVACLLVPCLGKSLPAYGWDNPGHMAVAGVAFDELTKDQQTKLASLLRQHPLLSFINEGFPGGSVSSDHAICLAGATWPDLARRHATPVKEDAVTNPQGDDIFDTGYEEQSPAVTEVHFDHLLHRGWHFIDTPLWVDKTHPMPAQLPPAPAVNAVGVVKVLVQQLKTNESDAAKAYDLCWLMHLVGDLHQPLHAVNGISEALRHGDRGGNEVGLDGANGGEKDLHAFWDNVLGKTAAEDKTTGHPRLDRDVATASKIVTDVAHLSMGTDKDNLDPMAWAQESFTLAGQDAYDLTLRPTLAERPGSHHAPKKLEATLSADYAATAKQVAGERVRLGGHRLALLLKDILK